MAVQVPKELCFFITKMWVLLDKDNKTVIGWYPPDTPIKNLIIDESNGHTIVPVTLENSPAYVQGTYENGKFYPPKEIENA